MDFCSARLAKGGFCSFMRKNRNLISVMCLGFLISCRATWDFCSVRWAKLYVGSVRWVKWYFCSVR